MRAFQRSFLGLCLVTVVLALCANMAAASSRPSLKVKPTYDVGALTPGGKVQVHVLVTIEAPEVASKTKRPPVAVSLVIDRSTSMYDAKKIDYARIAGKVLVDSLEKDDLLALTVYDSKVSVLYPLAEVTDKDKLRKIIDSITPTGMTFLSGGLEEGIKQLEKVRSEGPSRVILLSDGQANRGVTDPEAVSEIGVQARKRGIGVSTVGLGLSFQEDLMQYLAQRGGGQYYYIKDSEDLPGMFKQELDLVVRSFTKALRTRFSKTSNTDNIFIYGYTTKSGASGTDIDMGDFSGGEKRQILLRLDISAPEKDGRQLLGNLHFDYTDPETSSPQSLTIPIEMDVLTDDGARKEREAANAADITVVKDEVLLLEAEQAHVAAIQELQKGNTDDARKILKQQESKLAAAAPRNQMAKNKLDKIQQDEKNLESARQSAPVMMEMSKSSKASAYKSAQGKKQGLMLSPGDRGFQVEKLQRALKAAGFWKKDIDGVYSKELEEAVKKFQSTKSLTPDGVAGQATQRALGM